VQKNKNSRKKFPLISIFIWLGVILLPNSRANRVEPEQSRLKSKKIGRNVDFPKGNCPALADCEWRAAAPGLGGLVRAG